MKKKTISKKKYEALKKQIDEANKSNDYSKMIMMGSPEAIAMKQYEQDNICKHPNVSTSGGMDYCTTCGKTF